MINDIVHIIIVIIVIGMRSVTLYYDYNRYLSEMIIVIGLGFQSTINNEKPVKCESDSRTKGSVPS